MTQWPYIQPATQGYTYTFGTSPTLEQIRQVVAEEIQKALHPEEQGESATVEYEQGGKRWRGTVYLVEDEEED
jgi:hypothetical protein